MARMLSTVWSRSASPQNDQIGSVLSLAASLGLAAAADRHDGGEPLGMGRGQVPASVAAHGQAGQDHAVRVGGEVVS